MTTFWPLTWKAIVWHVIFLLHELKNLLTKLWRCTTLSTTGHWSIIKNHNCHVAIRKNAWLLIRKDVRWHISRWCMQYINNVSAGVITDVLCAESFPLVRLPCILIQGRSEGWASSRQFIAGSLRHPKEGLGVLANGATAVVERKLG